MNAPPNAELFDDSFLRAIPAPAKDERRSLVNIKAHHPHLFAILNRWYLEDLPNGDADLASRLRAIEDSVSFTAAFWELLVLRLLRKRGHEVQFHSRVGDKYPEFFWPEQNITGEVVSISDPAHDSATQRLVRELVGRIEELNLPFRVFLSEYRIDPSTFDGNAFLGWLRRLVPTNGDGESQAYESGATFIEVMVFPHSEGGGGTAFAMESLDAPALKLLTKRRIEEKLKKYRGPLVLFCCAGLGMWNLDQEILMDVLYGGQEVVFYRNPDDGEGKLRRKLNGIFVNRIKPDPPAHRRLLAVVFVDRQHDPSQQGINVIGKVFHNPYGDPALSLTFFGDMAQFAPAAENIGNIQMETVNGTRTLIQVV